MKKQGALNTRRVSRFSSEIAAIPDPKTCHFSKLLARVDEFAIFRNDHAMYSDVIGDISTTEPTMDGTAEAMFLMAFFSINSFG